MLMPRSDPVLEEAPSTQPGGSLDTAPPQSKAALEQLERVLASRFFVSTKRYSGLLKYLVDHRLSGQLGSLKERTIGVEVFGRAPEYDCNTDHVVRTAVGEVRKRLAQYYSEPNRSAELRIEIPPGTYLPQFRACALEHSVSVSPAQHQIEAADEDSTSPKPGRFPRNVVVAAVLTAGVVAASVFVFFQHSRNVVDRFWFPLTASNRPILLCVGDLSRSGWASTEQQADSLPESWTLSEFGRLHAARVYAGDAVALARLAGVIQPRHPDLHILSQSETTLDDLRGVPTILIGLGTNEWASRLNGRERFSFARTGPTTFTIRDKEHPLRNDWSVDYATPYLLVNRDYAVVSRVRNPTTEQVLLLVGGIYTYGNVGAAEFLSNQQYLKTLEASAPAGWESKNLEFVLSVDVIKGKSGVPRLLAEHFW